MPVLGGSSVQVTFFGATYTRVAAWSPAGDALLVCSDAHQVHPRSSELFRVMVTLTPTLAPVYVDPLFVCPCYPLTSFLPRSVY